MNRSRRDADTTELERRLGRLLDDSRTPGAPATLHDFLTRLPEEAEMDERGSWWRRVARRPIAVRLAGAIVVVAVAVVAVGIAGRLPGSVNGTGAQPSSSVPPLPSLQAGWRLEQSVGSNGPDGITVGARFVAPLKRLMVSVSCSGPSDIVVILYPASRTVEIAGALPLPQPGTGSLFTCGSASNSFELNSDQAYGEVMAVALRRPDTIRDTPFRVTIAVPDATPPPSAEATSTPSN